MRSGPRRASCVWSRGAARVGGSARGGDGAPGGGASGGLRRADARAHAAGPPPGSTPLRGARGGARREGVSGVAAPRGAPS